MRARGLLYRVGNNAYENRTIELRTSILEHLSVMLNTRCGGAATAPGFGVVDLSDITHAFPEALETLQTSVKRAIETFEPRLRNVVVRALPTVDGIPEVKLEIVAQAVDVSSKNAFHFETTLSPGGRISVR